MIELISRESLLKKYDAEHIGKPGRARRLIEEEPTVEERKTGKWIADVDRWGDVITTVNGYTCSKCGAFNTDRDNFCPNCGAKMEGEIDE